MLEATSREEKRAWIIRVQIVAVLLAAACAVYPQDNSIAESLRRLHPTLTTFIETVRLLGKFDIVFLFMLLVCWAGGNKRMLWRFVPAAAMSGILVLIIKVTVGRPRPGGDGLSFPSGDSSIAFVWATIVAAEYPVLAVPCFVAATAVAAMRVVCNLHYLSDVFAGSAVGLAAAAVAIHTVRNDAPEWLLEPLRRATAALAGLVKMMLRLLRHGSGSVGTNAPGHIANTSPDRQTARLQQACKAALIVSALLLDVLIRAFTDSHRYPVIVLAAFVMALALGWFLVRIQRGRPSV